MDVQADDILAKRGRRPLFEGREAPARRNSIARENLERDFFQKDNAKKKFGNAIFLSQAVGFFYVLTHLP